MDGCKLNLIRETDNLQQRNKRQLFKPFLVRRIQVQKTKQRNKQTNKQTNKLPNQKTNIGANLTFLCWMMERSVASLAPLQEADPVQNHKTNYNAVNKWFFFLHSKKACEGRLSLDYNTVFLSVLYTRSRPFV